MATTGVLLFGDGLANGLHQALAQFINPTTSQARQPLPKQTDFNAPVEQTFLVKFKPSARHDQMQAAMTTVKAKVYQYIEPIDTYIANIPTATTQLVVDKLEQNPIVEYAEVDKKVVANATSVNDARFDEQYNLVNTKVPEAWDTTMGSATVKVAILDTGILDNHEDLSGQVVATNNFTNDEMEANFYHGTRTGGIIAAKANNGVGIAGVAPNSKLISAQILNHELWGNYSWLVSGITWATDQGAKVINMSVGFYEETQGAVAFRDAVDYAWNNGVVVVASAGNNGSDRRQYPAVFEHVLSVASVDSNDTIASDSTRGDWVDVTAPGKDVLAPCSDNGINSTYCTVSGTSYSSPLVAGIAALLFSAHPTWTNEMVRKQIEVTSDAITGTGTYWQYGRVNAYEAVTSPAPTADLTVSSLVLTDASGRVRTSFFPGEAIYPKFTIDNDGGLALDATSDTIVSQVYSDASSTVATDTVSDVSVSATTPELSGQTSATYDSLSDPGKFGGQKYWTMPSVGSFTARVYVNYNQDGQELSTSNNQLTASYSIVAANQNTAAAYPDISNLIKTRVVGQKYTLIKAKADAAIIQLSCYTCGLGTPFTVYSSDSGGTIGQQLASSTTASSQSNWDQATLNAPLESGKYYVISFTPATLPAYHGSTSNLSNTYIDFLSYFSSGTPVPKTGAYYIQVKIDR